MGQTCEFCGGRVIYLDGRWFRVRGTRPCLTSFWMALFWSLPVPVRRLFAHRHLPGRRTA